MIAHAIFFYIFSFIAIVSAIMVTVSKNTVHSVFFLILDFISISCLFIMIGAEFLGMIMLIVYVGAVAVLFLFVVMMLDTNFVKLREGFLQYLPFGALLGIVLVIELGILYLTDTSTNINYNQTPLEVKINDLENTKMIGQLLYTKYFYLFQICGIILLVAMIGSITLTLRDKGGVKRQNINIQNTVDAEKAIEKKQVKLGEGI